MYFGKEKTYLSTFYGCASAAGSREKILIVLKIIRNQLAYILPLCFGRITDIIFVIIVVVVAVIIFFI